MRPRRSLPPVSSGAAPSRAMPPAAAHSGTACHPRPTPQPASVEREVKRGLDALAKVRWCRPARAVPIQFADKVEQTVGRTTNWRPKSASRMFQTADDSQIDQNGVSAQRTCHRAHLDQLKDRTMLAVRIWLPDDAEQNPIPAILEYLPYRQRDGTYERDALTHPYLAGTELPACASFKRFRRVRAACC